MCIDYIGSYRNIKILLGGIGPHNSFARVEVLQVFGGKRAEAVLQSLGIGIAEPETYPRCGIGDDAVGDIRINCQNLLDVLMCKHQS